MTEPQEAQSKTAADLIPGSLKRSPSYAEELAHVTQETLEQLARDTTSSLYNKARAMLKLIKQSERLREKVRQKGGRS